MPELHAGELSAIVAEDRLQAVQVAGHLALDTVYVAVRDAGWRDVPGCVVDSSTATTSRGTISTLEVRHQLDDIDFRWQGVIHASPGQLSFTMDGVAGSSFEANRIGFCLLHPQALKGQPVRVSGPGGEQAGTFPAEISANQLFVDVEQMRYGVGGRSELEIRFEGDLFEVEDHRNWSDPGWKTYGTPLSSPRPRRYEPGQRVRQAIRLLAHPATSAGPRLASDPVPCVNVGREVVGTVPLLGLGACCLPSVAPAARAAVHALRPRHLHVELEDGTEWPARLELAAAEAADLGVPLDVGVVADPSQVAYMARRIAQTAELGRLSVFSPERHTTDVGTVAAARRAVHGMGRDAQIGGGSRAHFAELNRGHFDTADWDFVTYGLTPQVHHTDDSSILATAAAIADGVAQARMIGRGAPVDVGPITLRPRFNATAEQPDPLPPEDNGPDVDDRQHTPLTAVYLAAAVSGLVGARAATAFRTIGPRGIVTADGKTTPAAEVFALCSSLGGASVRQAASTGGVTTLAVIAPPGLLVLASNTTSRALPLQLAGVKVTGATVVGGEILDPEGLVLPARSVTALQAVDA